MKAIRIRPLADRDIDLAVVALLAENPRVARRFLAEMESAFARIAERPAIGSQRYSHVLKGVRFWRLNRFPYLVFYILRPGGLEVLRVLHEARDLPAALRPGTESKM